MWMNNDSNLRSGPLSLSLSITVNRKKSLMERVVKRELPLHHSSLFARQLRLPSSINAVAVVAARAFSIPLSPC